MNSSKHPKHKTIASMVLKGRTDTAIAADLHLDRRTVAAIRAELGVAPTTNSTTKEAKLNRFSTEPDPAGHVLWTGRFGTSGSPIIRHLKRDYTAASVAFERRTGRKPVGTCRADCGMTNCVADDHVEDDIERRTVRLQLRALHGREAVWDECKDGHSWEEHGRIEPNLTPYCRRCNTERARRSRDARKAERTV